MNADFKRMPFGMTIYDRCIAIREMAGEKKSLSQKNVCPAG